jgi:Zn-dependent peptidase ImmA (M78 family)
MDNPKLIAAKKSDNFLVSCGIKDAPVDLAKILTFLGIIFEERFEIHDELFGIFVATENNSKKYIVLNNRYHIRRKNFVLAHLIGHCIFHWFLGLHYETTPCDLLYTNTFEVQGSRKMMEIEANNFAVELIMPEKFLIKDIRSRKQVESKILADKYMVSEYVMKVRLRKLGLI